MNYKPVSHKNFKKEALNQPKVLQAYNELEDEFKLVAKSLNAKKMAVKQSIEDKEDFLLAVSVLNENNPSTPLDEAIEEFGLHKHVIKQLKK